MSFNVNGSFVNKLESTSGGHESLKECIRKYDCAFFSETWTNRYSCIEMNEYVVFRKERVRREGARRDSGGLVCYFKESVAKGVSEVEWNYEDGMCFKLDRDYFGWEEHVFLLCVYMKPKDSTREAINAGNNIFDVLTDMIARMSVLGSVIVMGDMNARTGQKQECVIFDDDNMCNGVDRSSKIKRVRLLDEASRPDLVLVIG